MQVGYDNTMLEQVSDYEQVIDLSQTVPEEKIEIKSKLFYRVIKRGFDIIASILGLIILAPLFLIVAYLIKKKTAVLYFSCRKEPDLTTNLLKCINLGL